MATKEVVDALVGLADSMRAEGLAKLSYVGSDFEREAEKLINDRESKRAAFESALDAYVQRLVKA